MSNEIIILYSKYDVPELDLHINNKMTTFDKITYKWSNFYKIQCYF